MAQSEINFATAQVSEITLSYRPNLKPSQRPKVTCSGDACEIFRQVWDPDKIEFIEEFRVMLLNRANRVIGIVTISAGGISGTVADPKLIFAAGLKACASSLILAHNHPSGNLNPSQADIKLTQKLKKAGEVLEMPVLDHIILTGESFYSFADEGLA